LPRAAEVQRARAGAPPARWLLPGFARDVDFVRRQLGPLRDRLMLAASYERESARLAALRRFASDPAAPPLPVDPLEAAYAVRWLELTDGGAALPPWAVLMAPDTEARSGRQEPSGWTVLPEDAREVAVEPLPPRAVEHVPHGAGGEGGELRVQDVHVDRDHVKVVVRPVDALPENGPHDR
jgi:hypothetical protein